MAAKIIMVVQNQDFFVSTGLLSIEVGRGETADAAAHDDQIVGLIQLSVLLGFVTAPGQIMSDFKGPGMAAAYAGEGWGVIRRTDPVGSRGYCSLLQSQQTFGRQCATRRQNKRCTV